MSCIYISKSRRTLPLLMLMLVGCTTVQNEPVTPAVIVIPELEAKPTIVPGNAILEPVDLLICDMKVSNAPPNTNRKVIRQSNFGCLNGVSLNVAPAPGACVSSGFGFRPRHHKGVDYFAKPGSRIVAAAVGTIVEFGFRQKDFGHWMVIDHGAGVYTAYAHLQNTAPGLKKGVQVESGQQLGGMGKSGNSTNSIHLHYEVRQGDLKAARSWFLMDPVDPYSLPEQCPAS